MGGSWGESAMRAVVASLIVAVALAGCGPGDKATLGDERAAAAPAATMADPGGHWESRPLTWQESYDAAYGGCARGADGDPNLLQWCVGYSSNLADVAVAAGAQTQVWVPDPAPEVDASGQETTVPAPGPSDSNLAPAPAPAPRATQREFTCADLGRMVTVRLSRVREAQEVGVDLWPRLTVANRSPRPVVVTFAGHGKASDPDLADFPMEMDWGVDDSPLSVAVGTSRTVDLGHPYGEDLYVPPGGKVLAFTVVATADAEPGPSGCKLAVRMA